jgi:hypothetical protein
MDEVHAIGNAIHASDGRTLWLLRHVNESMDEVNAITRRV